MKKIVFTGGGTVGHVTLNLLLMPKFIEEPPAARSGICSEMEQVNLSCFGYQPSYRLRNSVCLLIYTAYSSTNRRCFAIHTA